MQTSRTIDHIHDSGCRDVVELHWMLESDLTMHTASGVDVPALCGAWMAPDEGLAAAATHAGLGGPRYVSCGRCDALLALAMTA